MTTYPKDRNARYKRRLMKRSIKEWKEVIPCILEKTQLKSATVFDAGAGYAELLLAFSELNLLKQGYYIDNHLVGYQEEVFNAYQLNEKYFSKKAITLMHKEIQDPSINYSDADIVVKVWVPHTKWSEVLKNHRPGFILTTDRDDAGVEVLGYELIDKFFHCSEETMKKDKEYFKYHGDRKPYLLYKRKT